MTAKEYLAFQRELDRILDKKLKRKAMEMMTEWKREGRKLGRQEGRQEGELAIVLRQLERRLGPLPAPERTRINTLTLPRLEALAEALLDFTGGDDLKHWLEETAN